tara:strand:+ start:1436 stop:2251 length:816 start_codon:yes stop_codon:yes gene_type:complete
MADIEEDFLENDSEIRGQNYCLLSFISPEKVLKEKNMYYIEKFLKHIAPECQLDADKISEKYLDFMYTREDNLSNEFNKKNEFRTSVRGIKVRGTYESLNEAQIRAKRLQNMDKNFHVFVGQVGYWLPWDPQADYIDNQEFQNAELNKLMKEYKANSEHRDIMYEDLKQEKINKIKEENKKIQKDNPKPEVPEPKESEEPKAEESKPEDPVPEPEDPVPEPEEPDPTVNVADQATPESESDQATSDQATSDQPDGMFGEDDAWVQRKLNKN